MCFVLTAAIRLPQLKRKPVRKHGRLWMRASFLCLLQALLLLLPLAVAPSEAAAQSQLILRDSIALQETEETYIGLPVAVTIDGDGYLVVDARTPQVLRFDGAGELEQHYGREGEGPGEFKNPLAAFPYGDDQIIVFSWNPPAAQVYRRSYGGFVERYGLDGPIRGVLLRGRNVWLSGVRFADSTSVRHRELGRGTDASLSLIPQVFREDGPLGGIFSLVPIEAWADTLLVGFEPLDRLFVVSSEGQVLDSLSIPASQRRGTPVNPAEAVDQILRQGSYSEVFGALSTLRAIHRRSDGSTLLVYFDHRADGPPVTSQVFVTVLSPDRRQACIDAELPISPNSSPAVGFADDDLLVLEQVLVGTDAVPILKRFEVDSADCDWVAAGA